MRSVLLGLHSGTLRRECEIVVVPRPSLFEEEVLRSTLTMAGEHRNRCFTTLGCFAARHLSIQRVEILPELAASINWSV